MSERRKWARYNVSFPIRAEWKNENGKRVTHEGLTENVSREGALVYLPNALPPVGSKVNLTVTENPSDEVTVKAEVIRVERDPAHPKAALHLLDSLRPWKKKVWELAGELIASQKSDDHDEDW